MVSIPIATMKGKRGVAADTSASPQTDAINRRLGPRQRIGASMQLLAQRSSATRAEEPPMGPSGTATCPWHLRSCRQVIAATFREMCAPEGLAAVLTLQNIDPQR